MGTLADFQSDFWAALTAPPGTPAADGLASAPGFAVYRNTVFKGCCDALVANYPSLVHLLGEDCLRAIAADHVVFAPPRSAVLADYGAGLPEQIVGLRELDDWPWLTAVARLDRAWTEAHLAADAAPAAAAQLACLAPAALGALRLAPHPSARWVWSDEWPLNTLWRAAREGTPESAEIAWVAQGVLIVRPAAEVETGGASRADCVFLDACAAGAPLATAAAAALATDPQADLAALLAGLLLRGALTNPSITPKEHA